MAEFNSLMDYNVQNMYNNISTKTAHQTALNIFSKMNVKNNQGSTKLEQLTSYQSRFYMLI